MQRASYRNPIAFFAAVLVTVVASGCGTRTVLTMPDFTPEPEDERPIVGCTSGTTPLKRAVPAVAFVIDRSTSMVRSLSGARNSRWQILNAALERTLPPVDDSMQVGALLYPSGTATTASCSAPSKLDLAVGEHHVAQLLSLVHGASVGGHTPTASAIETTGKQLAQARAASGARAMVLATDGGPNCNTSLDVNTCQCTEPGSGCHGLKELCLDDARTVSTIADYAQRGIPTYVIGIQDTGDTAFTSVLNRMAEAGGRPRSGNGDRFYSASSQSALETALLTIRDQVSACTFLTTSVPRDGGTITVTVDGVEIPYDQNAAEDRDAGARGIGSWHWGDKNNGEIIFAGSACYRDRNVDATRIAKVECDAADSGTQ